MLYLQIFSKAAPCLTGMVVTTITAVADRLRPCHRTTDTLRKLFLNLFRIPEDRRSGIQFAFDEIG